LAVPPLRDPDRIWITHLIRGLCRVLLKASAGCRTDLAQKDLAQKVLAQKVLATAGAEWRAGFRTLEHSG
jgi:hypothetical protein